VPQGAFVLSVSQGRNLIEARPILILQHHAGRVGVDDAADDLVPEGRMGRSCRSARLPGLTADDLVVLAHGKGRHNHHARSAGVHDFTGKSTHGGEARCRNAGKHPLSSTTCSLRSVRASRCSLGKDQAVSRLFRPRSRSRLPCAPVRDLP